MPGGGGYAAFSLPITIDDTNDTVLFYEEDNVNNPLTATVTHGTYFWKNTYSSTDLLNKLLSALTLAPNSGFSYNPVIYGNGKLAIVSSGNIKMLWNGAAGQGRKLFGFDIGTTPTYAKTVIGDFQVGKFWVPKTMTVDDSEEYPQRITYSRMSDSGRRRTQQWGGDITYRDVELDLIPGNTIYESEEEDENESFQRLWDELSIGTRFEYRPRMFTSAAEAQVIGSATDSEVYQIRDQKWMRDWPVKLNKVVARRFDVAFPMQVYEG